VQSGHPAILRAAPKMLAVNLEAHSVGAIATPLPTGGDDRACRCLASPRPVQNQAADDVMTLLTQDSNLIELVNPCPRRNASRCTPPSTTSTHSRKLHPPPTDPRHCCGSLTAVERSQAGRPVRAHQLSTVGRAGV
jgi:hypothetical protein